MERVRELVGDEKLKKMADLQGVKVGERNKRKFLTGVWLFDSPVNHFIYRLCIYLAPHSDKDWAKGMRFIEWVLANCELGEDEKYVLEGLSAIHGSRNGVFWKNAVAVFFWRDRIIQFLEHMQEVQTAQRGDSGGKTRDYLLEMLKDENVYKAIGVMAMHYLAVYMPAIGAITHVEHLYDLERVCNDVYTKMCALKADPLSLFRGEFKLFDDYRNAVIARKLAAVTAAFAPSGADSVDGDVREMVGLVAGGIAEKWHQHTQEWQRVEHVQPGEEGYEAAHREWEKRGSLHLQRPDWQRERSCNVKPTGCCVERVFGIGNYIADKTNCCLRADRLEGRVQCKYNDSIEYVLTNELFVHPAGPQRAAAGAALNKTLRELLQRMCRRLGTIYDMLRRAGLIAMRQDEEMKAKGRAAKEKREAEAARMLAIVLLNTWDELKDLTVEQLKEQVRARKFRGASVLLRDAASGKSCLRTLNKLLGLGVPDAQIAGNKPTRAKKRKKGPVQYYVERVHAALVVDGQRVYLVEWKGYPDEADYTWEIMSNFISDGAIHAETEQQIVELDAVTEEDVIALDEMAQLVDEASVCAIDAGARVVVDTGESWLPGAAQSALPRDARPSEVASVLVDGAAQPAPYARSALLVVPATTPIRVGALVRVAFADDRAPITGRRWQYGKVTKVSATTQLCSIDFDNGEKMEDCPLFEVQLVQATP